MNKDWQVDKSTLICSECGKEFAPRENYFSAIITSDEEEYTRKDYCAACWNKNNTSSNFFSYWRTVVPDVDDKKDKDLVNYSSAKDLFLSLIEDAEERQQKRDFIYILALVLLRKKILKLENIEKTDSDEYLVLSLSSEGETVKVINPVISNDKIEELSRKISTIFT